MMLWLLAVLAGSAAAVAQYRFGVRANAPLPLALRASVYTIALALLFDAPIGPASSVGHYVALDASASWQVAGNAALWAKARTAAENAGGDTLLLLGDSLRVGVAPVAPMDGASRVAPLVERVLGAGRPVVLVTDGRIDDAARLAELPGGSRVIALDGAGARDAALVSIDGPAAVVAGDTAEFAIVVSGGAAGAAAGRVELTLAGLSIGGAAIDSLAPYAEREVKLRSAIGGEPGFRLLRAVVTSAGDAIARNDTLTASLEIARGASAVFVSTAPDVDAREALAVLRGTLAVPTRGYLRVAPGQWRVEGSLASVTEAEVRRTLSEAPLAFLHGDTAIFGAPRALTHGALALMAPSGRSEEYYAMSAPPSPLAAALGALPWDSLPPVEVGDPSKDAEWTAVTVRRARRFDERPMISGVSSPRRIVVIHASGMYRWRLRGGRSAEAFTAIWGSVFDWMTGDATDNRAARPASPWVRAGEPVRWRRGSPRDTTATVVLRPRSAAPSNAAPGSANPQADTLTLHFAGATGIAETAPLAPGVYDLRSASGDGLLVVNASAEWLPRKPSVVSGAIGGGAPSDRAPRARMAWWLYAVLLGALCGEWVLRRKIGLR